MFRKLYNVKQNTSLVALLHLFNVLFSNMLTFNDFVVYFE